MPAEEALPVKRPSGKNAAVTMRDVATQSGFSPATVSIVLNNAPLARYIAPATKKRIEEVAQEAGLPPERDGAVFAEQADPQRGGTVFGHHRSLLYAGDARH